jgi:hypothetical protein
MSRSSKIASESNAPRRQRCRARQVLLRRIEQGKPLPISVIRHLDRCPTCRDWAQRVLRVEEALRAITNLAPPKGLTGRANEKALRVLVGRIREAARRSNLHKAEPPTTWWSLIDGPLERMTATATAAMIVIAVQSGIEFGQEKTQDLATPLMQTHIARHIDPDFGLA